MAKIVLIAVDHSILAPEDIGHLVCLPNVSEEEEEKKLEREWEREIRDIGLYAHWIDRSEMKRVVRKVQSFWRKRGYKIIWRHYEGMEDYESIEDFEPSEEASEEAVRELTRMFRDGVLIDMSMRRC